MKDLKENLSNLLSIEKINEISNQSAIYVLYALDIKEKTKDFLKKEWKCFNLKRKKALSYLEYMDYLKSWNQEKYYLHGMEEMAYFIDKKTAFDYAIHNIGDMNEAGCYPYIIISQKPLNCVYANTVGSLKHFLFLFNEKKYEYEEISWNINEMTKWMYKEVNLFELEEDT